MATTLDPLAELRPIHWPETVPWWPVAPGWYLLLLLLLLSLALATVVWLHRRRRKLSAKTKALAMITRLKHHRGDDRAFVAELNQVLKQIALARFPREHSAGLSGEPWLAFLDRSSGEHEAFTSGPGHALGQAPYRRSVKLDDRDELLSLCKRWVDAIWQQDKPH